MRKNEAGIVSKLDLGNAYDHVKWVFLVELMKSVAIGICFWSSAVVSIIILAEVEPEHTYW